MSGELGASYCGVLHQRRDSETISVENKELRSYTSHTLSGVGIRVVHGDSMGFASTSDMGWPGLRKALESAVKGARSMPSGGESPLGLHEVNVVRDELAMKIDPYDVPPEEKVALVLDTDEAAWNNDAIRNTKSRWGFILDRRTFVSSEGANVELSTPLIGMAVSSVAVHAGGKEGIGSSKSLCAGYEFMKEVDWNGFAEEISDLAAEAVKAETAPAGTYKVVVDPDIVGLVFHEALGHATEGDDVASGGSCLHGRLGSQIGSEHVTICDEGVVRDGFYMPYDDEGTRKGRLTLIEDGVLKAYLSDRRSARKLGVGSSGNGRVQDFENSPLVRMTNYYVEPRDHSLEELVEGVDDGILIQWKGGRGGQVDSGMGTFSFGVGPSRIIKGGELRELVRGVVISGSVLDVLKSVDAVGKDFKMRTSVFGGCGKKGQWLKVGMGGASMRAEMTVGGR